MKRIRNRGMRQNGFVLISVYIVLLALIALGGVLVAQAVAEVRATQRSQASFQALYLAEAGVDQGIDQLRQDYNWSGTPTAVSLGNLGTYGVQVDIIGDRRRVTSTGSSNLLPGGPISRRIEAIIQRDLPPNFYDNVIWASQNLLFKGNAFSVTGEVIHGDSSPEGNMGNVNGSVTYDASANPLPRLNFQQLYDMAVVQGNVYNAARLGNGHGVFPTSFWYRAPGANGPNDPGEPNVNYITTDLILNGNIGTIGGFFVVVGDVLTDPTATEDTTINGNGQIAGCIYTTGNFRVNGGGDRLNVDGGIWAGEEARLNGKVTMTYNATYMNALRDMELQPDVQVVSWRDRDLYP